MLQLFNVTKSYNGFPALEDVSLEVPSGQVWALTGPNGAGKTTLLKIMAGLFLPDEGHLTWGPFSPDREPEKFKQDVHYVPQRAGLYPNLTVGEMMQFFARLRKADNLEDIFERFALGNLKERLLKTLSGGQRQRVVVAQAFLGKGSYLLLDEPTVNLDSESVCCVKRELRSFADQGGTVILASHIASDLIEGLVDRRVMLENGSIQAIV